MRVVSIDREGGPDVLRVADADRPTPRDDEVRVEVRAAGVNPVDTYMRATDESYRVPSFPAVLGLDFAGVVDAVGESVEDFAVGDRVFGTGLDAGRAGGYAEYTVAPTDRVARLPDGVPFDAAGGLGVAAVTAWRALIDHAGLEPGETCLIHGGSGGVGHAAVQIAAATGAHVVTTASERYHDDLRALGADAVLDYRRDDLAAAVVEATDGGPDAILDHMLHEYMQFDADVVARYGRVVFLRNRHLEAGFTDVPSVGGKELTFTVMSMFNAPSLREPLERLARLLAAGDLTIRVARTYPLSEAAVAHRAVEEESFLGKVVLTP
ncbi:NADPH:quinone reductase [Halomarina halobia]|uniref:NADPH:quinone reductase n=1 Tax=Halomarina halobia TaxID=3033386 RepID=A0ABD6ABN0_9EURY|nr:NADPH:quinone reductase [Halomarina sp. PSR21]